MNYSLLSFLTLSFLSTAALAQHRPSDVRQEIKGLSNRIYREADRSLATQEQLLKAKDHLNKAWLLLKDAEPSHDFTQCFNFAYTGYSRSLNSAAATDKAQAICKTFKDFAVLNAAYTYASRSLNSAAAMDMAASYAGPQSEGKVDLFNYMAEGYSRSLNSAAATQKSGENIAKLKLESLDCLKLLYPRYAQSLNSAAAMDKAVESCLNQ